MVEFDAFPNITASVHLAAQDDKPEQALQEYEDDDLSTSHDDATCRYIQSEPDRDFFIRVYASPFNRLRGQRIDVSISIDGLGVAHCTNVIGQRGCKFISYGQRTSATIRKAYRFAALVQAPNEHEAAIAASVERTKSIGCIEIRLQRSRFLRTDSYQLDEARAADRMVSEKVLKGGAKSHVTTFGTAVTVTPHTGTTHTMKFGQISKIKYFYRSRKDLQALMVIPRSPSPEPVELRDIDNMNPDQLRARLRQVMTTQASQGVDAKIKRERIPDISRRAKWQKAVTLVLGDDDEFHVESPVKGAEAEPAQVVELDLECIPLAASLSISGDASTNAAEFHLTSLLISNTHLTSTLHGPRWSPFQIFQGVSVSVFCDDTHLLEHSGPTHENSSLQCAKFIECKYDEEFKIVIECDNKVRLKAQALCIRIYVDGEYCDSRVCDRSIMKEGLVMHSVGRRTSLETCKPYTFSQIELSDQAPQLSQERLSDLGTIRIEFTHVRQGRPIEDSFSPLEPADSLRPKSLRKQNLSCAVGFGETREHVRLGSAIEVESIGDEHIVLLHYRIREELEAISNVPPPPVIDLTAEPLALARRAGQRRRRQPKNPASPATKPQKPPKVRKLSKKQKKMARFKAMEVRRQQGQAWLSSQLEQLLINGTGQDLGINPQQAREAIRSAAFPPQYVYHGGKCRQRNLKRKQAKQRAAMATGTDAPHVDDAQHVEL